MAYPALETELQDAELKPTITASSPRFNVALLSDGIPTNSALMKQQNGQPVWLQFSDEQPITIRFLGATNGWVRKMKYELQFSNDGINFKKHTKHTVTRPFRTAWRLIKLLKA